MKECKMKKKKNWQKVEEANRITRMEKKQINCKNVLRNRQQKHENLTKYEENHF